MTGADTFSRRARMPFFSVSSMAARPGELMSTSGSMMGTRPAASTSSPSANCWSSTSLMPFSLFSKTTERSFVPNTPLALARASSSFRPGIGFIICTPLALASRPLSIFRKGTTFFSSHRYWAASLPWNLPSSVTSNRMAPSTRSPLKAGLETMRSRILCTSSNISLSLLYSLSSTPYSFRALGVLPPLWSRAAMKPLPLATRSRCSVVIDMTELSPLEGTWMAARTACKEF